MGSLAGPRPGTPARKAMMKIVDMGGTMLIDQLRDLVREECPTIQEFRLKVMMRLEDANFITKSVHYVYATDMGKKFVGAVLELQNSKFKLQPYRGQIAAPREAPPYKPLDLAKYLPSAERRAGASEYRDIPSLMGGQRVARGDRDAN